MKKVRMSLTRVGGSRETGFTLMSKFHLRIFILLYGTCLSPVASFWFFSCRHGNGNGHAGDTCSVFCQCRRPNTCEAGIQRCVPPAKVNELCHATRPCRKGLSCHPGIQRCYHVPRRLHEPCVMGYSCESGLTCEPGIQLCYHRLRQYNEPCVAGYACARGLSCQPGIQRCLHHPRQENERCSLGFECGEGLTCTLCAKPYLTCQMAKMSHMDNEFYHRPYNMVAFLVTHNSFSHGARFAVWARNQRVDVVQQLRDGVRGLMLDIYPGWGMAEVNLCHETCFWGGSTNLLDTLIDIRKFLEENPRDVVTIIFEDYLRNPTILKRVFDRARITRHVLRSKHWGNGYEKWPTLNDMRSLGRLVVFNNNGIEGFPYTIDNMWFYVRENRYGQPGLDMKTCVDREESGLNADFNDNWSLVLINWFGTATNPLNPCLNSFTKMEEKLRTCSSEFGQRANFLAVDYYQAGEDGGAFKAVKLLNDQWKKQYYKQRRTWSTKTSAASNLFNTQTGYAGKVNKAFLSTIQRKYLLGKSVLIGSYNARETAPKHHLQNPTSTSSKNDTALNTGLANSTTNSTDGKQEFMNSTFIPKEKDVDNEISGGVLIQSERVSGVSEAVGNVTEASELKQKPKTRLLISLGVQGREENSSHLPKYDTVNDSSVLSISNSSEKVSGRVLANLKLVLRDMNNTTLNDNGKWNETNEGTTRILGLGMSKLRNTNNTNALANTDIDSNYSSVHQETLQNLTRSVFFHTDNSTRSGYTEPTEGFDNDETDLRNNFTAAMESGENQLTNNSTSQPRDEGSPVNAVYTNRTQFLTEVIEQI